MCYLEAGIGTHCLASDKGLCQNARGGDTNFLVMGGFGRENWFERLRSVGAKAS